MSLTANSFTRLEIVILDRVGLVEFRVALVFRLGLGHKILCTRTLHHLVPVQDRNVATHFCFDVGDIVDGGLWDLVGCNLWVVGPTGCFIGTGTALQLGVVLLVRRSNY